MSHQSTTIHLIHPVSRENETLVAAYLFSDQDRAVSTGDSFLKFRLAIMRKGELGEDSKKIDYLGGWDSTKHVLRARQLSKITGQQDLFYPLRAGDLVVLEVTVGGQPTSEAGISLECEFRRVGEVSTERDRRLLEPDLPAPHRVVRPVFSLGRYIQQTPVREAVEVLEDDLNLSGVTTFFVSYPIAVAMGFRDIDYGSEDSDGPTGAPGPYQTLETLVLTPPDDRQYLAILMGRSSYSGAANLADLRISNTTDGVNGDPSITYSAAPAEWHNCATFFQEVIEDGEAKTYVLEGTVDAGGQWYFHQLTGFLIPVEQAARRSS